MTNSRLIAAILPALLAVLALVIASPARAQTRQCLVTAVSASQTVEYDPFNPSQLQVNNVDITFTRSNGPGGAKPAIIDLYVQSVDARANGIQLIPISAVGAGSPSGLNQNIFYNFPGPVPSILVPLGNSPTPGTFRWEYNGNNAASDVFVIRFNVVLPANLDLTASGSLIFNIEYGCNGTGGGPPFSERATAPNAFTLDINVLSALQASFVGTALDFGEIGDVTNTDVSNSPLTYVTDPMNLVRVQSSGPYQITLSSANNYVMTPAGANTADPLQRVGYRLKFLGQTRSTSNTALVNFVCPRAGVGMAVEDRLNIQAQLAEGGAGKAVSADYRDTLTVTLSPLIDTSIPNSGGPCDGLSGQFP